MEIKISKAEPATKINTNIAAAVKKAGPAQQKLKTLFTNSSSNSIPNKRDNNTLSVTSAQTAS